MTLDTLIYAQLIMAVGLTLDYVVHIAHAIAIKIQIQHNEQQ